MSEKNITLKERMKIEDVFFMPFLKNEQIYQEFNNRNYGVTVNYEFLVNIAYNEYFNTNHMVFFSQVFAKTYLKRKIIIADCYFFSEFMPQLTEQLQFSEPKRQQYKPSQKTETINPQSNYLFQATNDLDQLRGLDYIQQIQLNPDIIAKSVEQQPQQQKLDQVSIKNSTTKIKESQFVDKNKATAQDSSKNNIKEYISSQSTINEKKNPIELQKESSQSAITKSANSKPEVTAMPPNCNKEQFKKQELTNVQAEEFKKQQQQQEQELEKEQQRKQQQEKLQLEEQEQEQQQLRLVALEMQKIAAQKYYQHQQQNQSQQQQAQARIQAQMMQQKQQIQQQIQQQQQQAQRLREENAKKYGVKISNVQVTQVENNKYQKYRLPNLLNTLCRLNQLEENGKPFDQCEFAYFPINLANSHWVCTIFFRDFQVIQYLDPLQGHPKDIINGIQYVLQAGQQDKNDYQVQGDSPFQKNNYDCGVFCLMALLTVYRTGHLINKRSYTQEGISLFRQTFLHLAIIGSQMNLTEEDVEFIVNGGLL